MFFYSLFAFTTMGILISIFIINANETNKGIFTWSRDNYTSSQKGFDWNYAPLFLTIFVFSPFTLPMFGFAYFSYKVGTKLYNRYIKAKQNV